MLKVYGDIYSGNCYKLKLLMTQLGLPHAWVHMDILKKETRTAEFLARNPNGRVPVLELPGGVFLPESNAILHYLAEGSPLLPRDRLEHAQVLQWMFFEQYSHEPYIATSRYIIRYLGRPPEQEARLLERVAGGRAALAVMEQHLQRHDWFVGGTYTIADIALYAYSHVAHEGGFDLAPYPALRAWLARVASQPGYAGMDEFDAAIQAG
ncbi:glutathione S-transferase family protein [Solimonas sp. K1W22B-7]|uniref:glutathione S-transferase family protein n=1 Tax=Solimonas sp. K1W22B-7 TaxID=2303331 RepID=UPI000E32F4FB|nr:glutathione S-transferase family protein [Solimonas sp. K1W22B-7]AXQ29478.1 glutathione S-transferase family protein [Solimonas sp. K1W22B-7]